MEDEGVPYKGISTGKFRRYLSVRNLSDPFRVARGYHEASAIIRDFKPDVVFSKGGFVSVPVVLSAERRRIPVILHESDMTPGLANRLCIPKAARVCCNFPETLKLLPPEKAVLTGSPIRNELLTGSKKAGLSFAGLTDDKPVLLMMGGSSGSRAVNTALRAALPEILPKYHVIHLCGKGNLDDSLSYPGYVQYEYISAELKDLLAAADIVLSRAGANSICELLALRKPNILVPLPLSVSRGDQILNARSFEQQGFSFVLPEEELTTDTLCAAIDSVRENREAYIRAMAESPQRNGVDTILGLIREAAGLPPLSV